MFIKPRREELEDFKPFIKIFHAPFLKLTPKGTELGVRFS
jgi:hypothetical protein